MAASIATTGSQSQGPELSGRWIDALFGYGLFYLLSAPLVFWIATSRGLEAWPGWVVALSGLAIAGPHYGATLLRAYEKRSDRRQYAFFTLWLTLLLVACFFVSLFNARIGSWFLTAYVCLAPWHLAGQNFGVSMMSLRRRAVPIDQLARRLLHGSYFLSYLLAMVAIHRGGTLSEVAVGAESATAYHVNRLGLSAGLADGALWILGPAYLAVTAAALFRLGRGGHTRHLGPTMLLLAMQSLWYVIPAVSPQKLPLVYGAIWLSANHSLQYMWITTYYAKQRDSTAAPRFYWKCLLVGSALGLVPAAFFVPGLLGSYIPYATDVTIMVFTISNLHHYALDGAIWKLRDGKVAGILLNQSAASRDKESGGSSWRFIRPLVYATGIVALIYPLYLRGEIRLATNSETRSVVEAAASRLAFWGRDVASVHAAVGRQRNLAGDSSGAVEAYRRAWNADSEDVGIAARLAALLLDDPAGAAESLELASFASEKLGHSDPATLIILGTANMNAGRPRIAQSVFERAIAVAQEQGDARFVTIARQQLKQLESASSATRKSDGAS